jgi:hypothetical protein
LASALRSTAFAAGRSALFGGFIRAILITALRRLVNFDPRSPQTQALKAILERLEPQKPQPLPDTAGTG